ncbi:Oidioi.mRNA.OKI2018_I69.chr2.g5069.t1.cds [Oikopleura dioica]|uniref:Oidioi.mRNA.OKI2018_I69.chr2.g5069.t1.cds n=1 Tax=Oikopleura dioica TaxID=34765 RepID=A0ABN7T8G6_OIKDI|nr:Oidioi.mRNA.OKI2018_I69.chr2.g5069.t1.cds [Oikopleura dioica]
MGGCNVILNSGDMVMFCRDCDINGNMYICPACFMHSKHDEHNFKVIRLPLGGFQCSCGNSDEIRQPYTYCSLDAPKLSLGLAVRERTIISVSDGGIRARRIRQLQLQFGLKD